MQIPSSPTEPLDDIKLLFLLSRRLRRGPVTLTELAQETDLGEETVRELLINLQTLEPDFRLNAATGWYAIGEPAFTAAEFLTLHRGVSALAARGAEPATPLRELAARLAAPLPAHVRAALPSPALPAQQALQMDQVLPAVTQAWLGGHALRFEYLRPGRVQSRRQVTLQPGLVCVHPVTLELLVVGRELGGRRAQRTFRLARMVGAQVEPSPAAAAPVAPTPPASPVPTVDIHLRFTGPARLRMLEGHTAHLSEPVINPDGSVDATLRAPLDARAALPWILSWGAGAEVLSPAPLRAQWQAELRAALDMAQRIPTDFGAGAA